jgi:hypothetical protein
MATTYTLISSVTVGGGGTSTITLSSIPSTYTDLALLLCGRTTRASYVDDFVIKAKCGNNKQKHYKTLWRK